MEIISKNIKETEKIAKKFLSELKPKGKGATVVGLYGELGAGKTTFTQGLGKLLGIKRKVNSPTFVIMKKYKFSRRDVHKNFLANKTKPVSAGKNFYEHPAFQYLFHIDAYRLKNEKELKHIGWEDIISNERNLVFIEWPENIIKSMPKKHHKIEIGHTKEGHRKFKIR